MLQQDNADDFVVPTGENHFIREVVGSCFDAVELNWKDYVKRDESLFRPAEVNELKGDFTKARDKLKWQPKVNFEALVTMMVDEDLKRVKANL